MSNISPMDLGGQPAPIAPALSRPSKENESERAFFPSMSSGSLKAAHYTEVIRGLSIAVREANEAMRHAEALPIPEACILHDDIRQASVRLHGLRNRLIALRLKALGLS